MLNRGGEDIPPSGAPESMSLLIVSSPIDALATRSDNRLYIQRISSSSTPLRASALTNLCMAVFENAPDNLYV